MRKSILVLVITIGSFVNMFAQDELTINVSKSEIKWSGEYTFYFGGHDGTINFKSGHFIKTNNVITGGEFIIDMTSIKCLDIDNDEAKEGLVSHLEDPDFFEVENHKTAKLTINSVEYHDQTSMQIFADLTIKGKTNRIKFQAEVDFESKTMTTKFKIDRMKWGISYNSNLKDNAISDAIGFEVTLSL